MSLKQRDPQDLLRHHGLGNGQEGALLERTLSARGYRSADELRAHGDPAEVRALELAEEVEASAKHHSDELRSWLELINACSREIEALRARVDALEARGRPHS